MWAYSRERARHCPLVVSEIATTEPSELRAGDTWKWRREDLSDYPASDGWALTYRFRTPTFGFEVVAAADVDAFAVEVTPTENAEYEAGEYSWVARVTKLTEAYTIAHGSMTVLANLFAGDGDEALDVRSHAQKMLDLVEAALEALKLGAKAYSLGNREMTYRDISELTAMRDQYRAEVAEEKAAERIAAGKGNPRRVLARFQRV
jgi:hypothetical protein